jgi:predicted HicB family RNase H-like nuclease
MEKVEFRCSDSLKSKIEKAAKKQKVSVAQFLRDITTAALKKK